MSKIAIISQPDQGVLIDVGGCTTFSEAVAHLTTTLQVSSQFWKGVNVALNLGRLELTPQQLAQILAVAKGVGATPKHVFSENEPTRASLRSLQVPIGKGTPMTLPVISIDSLTQHELEEEESDDNVSPPKPINEEDALSLYETQDTLDFADSVAEGNAKEAALENAVDQVDEVSLEDREDPPKPFSPPVPAVLYLRQTLRSGQTVSHKGHLVIIGDVNPGAEVMAEGDVTVWGALRGIAHAGIGGNVDAQIRALKLQPIQIRIAHAIARSPDKPRVKFSSFANAGPETAKIIDGKIKIAKNNIE